MNLKYIRQSKKFTQQGLANKVGITRQMIGAIEKGANPSVQVAKKIAATLEFDWTLFFEEVEA